MVRQTLLTALVPRCHAPRSRFRWRFFQILTAIVFLASETPMTSPPRLCLLFLSCFPVADLVKKLIGHHSDLSPPSTLSLSFPAVSTHSCGSARMWSESIIMVYCKGAPFSGTQTFNVLQYTVLSLQCEKKGLMPSLSFRLPFLSVGIFSSFQPCHLLSSSSEA